MDERVSLFPEGQFEHLLAPYNRVSGIAPAHLHRVLAELRSRDDIDLVHDHVEVTGLGTLAAARVPTLHTLHWDLAKHRRFYAAVDAGPRLFVNGVSANQLRDAPPSLLRHSLGHVHLATPLADDADTRPLPPKEEHVVVLGRVTRCKGQHVAVRVAREVGWPLVLAGPVGPFHRRDDLDRAVAADPGALANPDVRYWHEEIAPHVDGTRVRWVGTVRGGEREHLLATAAAALFPITWEEPGGTAVTEALALVCAVVGFRRGCLPELVDHGRTGLLAEPDDEADLARQLTGSKGIDPAECVREAVRRFRPAVMADAYLGLYRHVAGVA
ncbi:glycosyltransferase [Saccharothrix hoggarensis]|uniref:Glycosyltransferase n=1 Tax=Saccharothrix hoggarensis TaxID=913853 RepID=A0ABW3QX36_9PSEU